MRFATVFRSLGLALFTFGAGLALSSCSKSDSDASSSLLINFGPGQGIQMRDGSNLPVGEQDPTDWTLDDRWNSTEQKLFQSLGLNLNGSVQNAARIYTAGYPNPTISQFNFAYTSARNAPAVLCKAVVVNQVYQVLREASSSAGATNQTFQFDVSGKPFQLGQRYRVYYVMYNGTTLYHKGHGDFKIVSPY